MSKVGYIGKDQKNTAQGYKFRGIDDMLNAFYPVLCDQGVFMVPSCESETYELKEVTRGSGKTGIDKHVHLRMKYTFYAEDGSFIVVGGIPSEGIDSGDKATNKALSAALKYALIQTFSIPTEDMTDGDKDSPVIAPEVKAQIVPVFTTPDPQQQQETKPLARPQPMAQRSSFGKTLTIKP